MTTTPTWKSGPSNAPLPPILPGLPVLGNALDLAQDVLQCLIRGYRTVGPIFRMRALNQTFTAIAGPEANLFFAREQGRHLRSKEFWAGVNEEMKAEHVLVSADGPEHAELRQISQRGYSRSLYEAHFAEVTAMTRQFLEQWAAGETRSVRPWVQALVIEQLGHVIVGRAPGSYGRDVAEFIRTALVVKMTRQRPGLLLHLPAYHRAKRRSLELAEQIVAYHRANPPTNREPNLMDDALAAMQAGRVLTENDLVPIALAPYIAGLDTSASTLSFMLYALFKNPAVLAQVQAEVDTLFVSGRVSPAALRKADVLHRAALETLRMYPIAPMVQRTVIEPFEFAGCRVEAGTRLFIGTTVNHFDEQLHPEPYHFDIDRYLPSRNEHRIPGAFAPFGLGPHTCLGAGLAEAQIMLTVATLLHTGTFTLSPANYTLQLRTLPTLAPADSFRLMRLT